MTSARKSSSTAFGVKRQKERCFKEVYDSVMKEEVQNALVCFSIKPRNQVCIGAVKGRMLTRGTMSLIQDGIDYKIFFQTNAC